MRATDEREAAFDEAFDRLYPQARALAHRILGDVARAEEVAAEALARAYARWRRLVNVDYLDAWVLRVTGNLAVDVVRRKRALVPRPVDNDDTDGVVLRMALVEALRTLPKRQREVLVLCYLADLRHQDAARVLGITEGAVKAHVHRALSALRVRLADPSLEEAAITHA